MLSFSRVIMDGTLVQGKVYAAFFLLSKDWGSRPLLAAMVKLDPSDGVTYRVLENSADQNGVFFWPAKIVDDGETLPMREVEEKYKYWIGELQGRYERKHKKTMTNGVPRLPSIVSGITFINGAVGIAVLSPETAQRCWMLKTSPLAKASHPLLPRGVLPALPGEVGHVSPAVAGDSAAGTGGRRDPALPAEVGYVSSAAVAGGSAAVVGGEVAAAGGSAIVAGGLREPALPGKDASTGSGGSLSVAGGQLDPVEMAMSEGGLSDLLGVASEVTVVDGSTEGQEGGKSLLVESPDAALEPRGQGSGSSVGSAGKEDEDRLVEDALELVQALPPNDRHGPIIDCLVTTMHNLQGKVKELKSVNMSLTRLTMVQDLKLKEVNRNAASDIVPGLLPAFKETMQEVQRDLKNSVKEEMDSIKILLKEEGRTAMTPELAAIRSAIATAENSKILRDVMGATWSIDTNLSSLGMRKGEGSSAVCVDIPATLVRIENYVKNSTKSVEKGLEDVAHSSSSLAAVVPPPQAPSQVGVRQDNPEPALPSPAPPAPPRRSRWDETSSSRTPSPAPLGVPPPTSSGTPSPAPSGVPPPSSTSRNLEAQFAAATPVSHPELYCSMVRAAGVWDVTPVTSLTKAQVDRRIAELSTTPVSSKRQRRT